MAQWSSVLHVTKAVGYFPNIMHVIELDGYSAPTILNWSQSGERKVLSITPSSIPCIAKCESRIKLKKIYKFKRSSHFLSQCIIISEK